LLALGWLVAFVATLSLLGCSTEDRQRIRSAAEEVGAASLASTLCAAAHGYDGQVPEAEAVLRWCSNPANLAPWETQARAIVALVNAQRAGKSEPEPEPPAVSPGL
jgi:hypothetical protein